MRPDAPSDPPVRVVEVLGAPLGVTDAGAGPAVVALHGLPGSGRDFRWLGAALEPHARFVRLDLPGFGASPARPGRSLARRAQLVAAALEVLELEPVVVLGHSMGGAVAAAVAALHPSRVAGVALIASVGRRPHAGLRSFAVPVPLLAAGLRLGVSRRILLPRLRAAFRGAGFRCGDDAIVETISTVAETSLDEHASHLAALRVATLVAWTADDSIVEEAIAEDLYWACPPGPRLRFADGGHNLVKTRAVEIAEALRAWMRQL